MENVIEVIDRQSSIMMKSAKELAAVAARIFGNHLGDGRRSGRKVLSKALKGPAMLTYYPEKLKDALTVDPDETRRVIKLERAKRRGKGPPKKGQGKRAVKGKGK